MKDEEIILEWRKSPLTFVRDVWGLVPQPLKPTVRNDLEWQEYKPEHFEEFETGKHLTWQQWLIFRAVERACQGLGPRRISVASGHGIGKSATMAMLNLWFLGAFTEPQIGCTANTGDQLSDVLWKECRKWLNKMPKELADEYDHQSAYIRMKYSPETAFARARTAKKENPEALAGLHAQHVMLLVDEASGVVEEVFETAEGALTNQNFFVVMISNPTRLAGYFYDSHHSDKKNWQILQFDSRESPIVDWEFVERFREKYGEDSPQWLVRVVGQFPDAEEDQFISRSLFDAAAERPRVRDPNYVRCLGVDVAYKGGDRTSLVERQGNMIEVRKIRQDQDTVATANDVMAELKKAQSEGNSYDFVMVDVIGYGAGTFDTLIERQKNGEIPKSTRILPVNFAEAAEESSEFPNKRVELWFRFRKCLETGSVDPQLRDDACSVKYIEPDSKGRLRLEPKDKTRQNSGQSPDLVDGAAVTFVVGTLRRKAKMQMLPPQDESKRIQGGWQGKLHGRR